MDIQSFTHHIWLSVLNLLLRPYSTFWSFCSRHMSAHAISLLNFWKSDDWKCVDHVYWLMFLGRYMKIFFFLFTCVVGLSWSHDLKCMCNWDFSLCCWNSFDSTIFRYKCTSILWISITLKQLHRHHGWGYPWRCLHK